MLTIDHLPERAATLSRRVRDQLLAILGDDLTSLWLHGGTTFADRPEIPGDLDIAGVIRAVTPEERHISQWRDDPQSRPARLQSTIEAIAAETGASFDVVLLLESEIGTGEIPGRAFWVKRREPSWPVYRAHWLAGQYVLLHGRPPDELVVAPTKAELHEALDREIEHLERHVYEGDAADPYEATYAIWNGCRILYTVETGSPVISKRSAGMWGLANLPEQWHDAIRAAGRNYDGMATEADKETLRLAMPPFVEMVRARLPLSEPRSGPPRWS